MPYLKALHNEAHLQQQQQYNTCTQHGTITIMHASDHSRSTSFRASFACYSKLVVSYSQQILFKCPSIAYRNLHSARHCIAALLAALQLAALYVFGRMRANCDDMSRSGLYLYTTGCIIVTANSYDSVRQPTVSASAHWQAHMQAAGNTSVSTMHTASSSRCLHCAEVIVLAQCRVTVAGTAQQQTGTV
eukprot:20353-Heterococcus_DN1.PRE.3